MLFRAMEILQYYQSKQLDWLVDHGANQLDLLLDHGAKLKQGVVNHYF